MRGDSLLKIPVYFIKDKQAFERKGGSLSLAGKPLDLAKRLKGEGVVLMHLIDTEALNGMPNNLDVYNGLTYIINVQVECAPKDSLVKKLLSLGCRVVLPPSFDATPYKEKKLLVAKIPKGYDGEAVGFHDVILEDADEKEMGRFTKLGKRIIIYEKDHAKLGTGNRKLPWGVISSS
ncbi:MAG: hypothetical protein V1827_03810 [Candidatus Micrarchaeota archaeon]